MGRADERDHVHALPAQAVPTRKTYLRAKILNDHLLEATRHLPQEEHLRLVDGLTYASAIRVLDHDSGKGSGVRAETVDEKAPLDSNLLSATRSLPGGLSKIDVSIFGAPSLRLTSTGQKQLTHELKSTILSISEFFSDAEAVGLDGASGLPDRIRSLYGSIQHAHELSGAYRNHIAQIVDEINEIHPRLEEDLVEALFTLPPILNATRTAEADLLSTTVEASLIMLSLIRTRTNIALYGHASPSRPQANMTRALAIAIDKLRAKQSAQEEEERELDAQLAAYDGMLSLVGGRDGNFAQVVDDMARMKRETDECRKDLRRLGWTGD